MSAQPDITELPPLIIGLPLAVYVIELPDVPLDGGIRTASVKGLNGPPESHRTIVSPGENAAALCCVMFIAVEADLQPVALALFAAVTVPSPRR